MSTSRRFRVAIAGFKLESVTFLPNLTTLADFQAIEAVGERIIERHRGANTPTGGFISVCERNGIEMVPIVYTEAGAAACASDEAFDHYLSRILEALAREKVDGVLLDLHGALVTPTRLDADGDIISAVRRQVGPQVRVMVALDYHANLDEKSLADADAAFGYHFSPHIDQAQTGERAAECMVRTLRGEITPTWSICKPGLMVPSIFSATDLEPLAGVVRESIRRADTSSRGYLDVSIFAGFSYADVPNCGFSVLAVTHANLAKAADQAAEFCSVIRNGRREFSHEDLVHDIDGGIAIAQGIVQQTHRPVVLLEHADRMVDSTHVLHAIVDRRLGRTAVPYIWDPAAVAKGIEAGEGARVTLSIGGHSSERAGEPVELGGTIRFAGPKAYRGTGAFSAGRWIDLGEVVVLDAGFAVVSITSRPYTAVSEDCFSQFGMDINEFDFVLLRSKTHFRAAFTDITAAIIIIDTPDWGPANLKSLAYVHVPRDKVYPFTA